MGCESLNGIVTTIGGCGEAERWKDRLHGATPKLESESDEKPMLHCHPIWNRARQQLFPALYGVTRLNSSLILLIKEDLLFSPAQHFSFFPTSRRQIWSDPVIIRAKRTGRFLVVGRVVRFEIHFICTTISFFGFWWYQRHDNYEAKIDSVYKNTSIVYA